MIPGLLGITVSLLIGYFICALLWPEGVSRTLAIAFAPAVGIGVCSIIFIAFRRPMFVVESVLLTGLAAAWLVSKKPLTASMPPLAHWRLPAVYLLLAGGAGMALSFWITRVERSPHGDWDAMVIWNSHARYLYRDGPFWQKTILNTFHANYPLLTAATTARLWRYMGQEIPDAGGALGALYALAAVGILAGTLAELRTASRAVLFALTLFGTPFFIDYGVSGSADVPLSLFILATLALLCLQSKATQDNGGLMVLTGFTAGCAGWTKNEGLLFVAAVSASMLTPFLLRPTETFRRFSAFAAGLAAPIIVILWFKLAVAPPGDILGGRHMDEIIQKVLTPQRYITAWTGLSEFFWSFGNWTINPILILLAYVALRRLDRKMLLNQGWLQGVSICVIMLAGYFVLYVISPFELQWHIESSLPRLYLHLWPAFLMLAGLVSSNPEPT
jgi:hypothetical protein